MKNEEIQNTGAIRDPGEEEQPNGRKLGVEGDHNWVQILVLQLTSYRYLFNISETQFFLQQSNIYLQSCFKNKYFIENVELSVNAAAIIMIMVIDIKAVIQFIDHQLTVGL